MVKIERDNDGFKMNFSAPGQRFSVIAKDQEEVSWAMAHYYGSKTDYQRHYNGQYPDQCPICRKYGVQE